MRKLPGSSKTGKAVLIVVLAVAVVFMIAWFIFDAYVQHIKDMKLAVDITTVNEAEDCATVQYLTDGCPEDGVTYYYDAESKTCINSEEFLFTVNIEGYGMSEASENEHGETGAVGIPNLTGDDDGAQFLAIAVKDSGDTVHSRWQGRRLTEYDLTLMTDEEFARLSDEQLKRITTETEQMSDAEG